MTLEDKYVDGVLIYEQKNISASLFLINMNKRIFLPQLPAKYILKTCMKITAAAVCRGSA